MCAWGIICDYLRENRLFYTYDNNNNGRSHGNKGNKGNSLEFIAHVILEKQSGNVPKGTKKKLQESCLSHVFCLRNLRDLRETYYFLCSNRLSTLM